MQDDDDNFLAKLNKPLQTEYKKEKIRIIKEIQDDFASRHSDLVEKKSKGIKQDKYHKETLNSCIFPFVQQGTLTPLGYVYLRSSPLSEKGLKNVDFLIASPSKKIAIFGEVKHSVTDPVPVLKEMKERIGIINQNIGEVKKIVPNVEKIEYVLGVQSMDSHVMSRAILRSDTKVILWEVGGQGEQQLSLVVPTTDDPTIRKSLMHSDNDLNHTLKKTPTSNEFKTFFQESHPVTKMELLAAIDKGREDETFTFSDVKWFVTRELDNTSNDEIETYTKSMLKLAIDIGFVNCDGTNGRYKIQSRFKNTTSRYDELKKKWIEYSIETEEYYMQKEKIEKLQQIMLEKMKSFPTLEPFFNDN